MTTITDTLTPITSKQFEMEVKEGLIYILNHLDNLWPRMVSTHATGGAQRLVNNFAEAMAFFKAASFLDCRISAYPKYTDYYVSKTGIAPTVLMVDIDKEHFGTPEEFELATTKTYSNFHNVLSSRPSVLWTGGGRHFLTPQSVPVFEKLDKFSKFDQPSRRFLSFEERLLTDDKADQSHWSTVSFNNMMLRIPGSLNSNYIIDGGKTIDIDDARVRIEKYWDGNTPTVSNILLMQYYNYLQFAEIRNIRKQKVREVQYRKGRIYGRPRVLQKINLHGYDYIEKLFNKPLDNFRKLCIWKIFVPYFINVKRLSRLEAFNRTKSWLDRSSSISKLNFNPRCKIDYALNNVGTFLPPYQDNLEQVNNFFYERLKREGII
ncbi:MAG: hypothetical protein WBZ36_24230 [Candidatus Nitrosopolaris sp.]